MCAVSERNSDLAEQYATTTTTAPVSLFLSLALSLSIHVPLRVCCVCDCNLISTEPTSSEFVCVSVRASVVAAAVGAHYTRQARLTKL